MNILPWRKPKRPDSGESAADGSEVTFLASKVDHRTFLKTLAVSMLGAGLAQVVGQPQTARASYIPGSPSDTVDTNLTVQGNLIVGPGGQGSMAVGTPTTQGKLHVAGDIWVNGRQVVGSDGVAKESYYAQ